MHDNQHNYSVDKVKEQTMSEALIKKEEAKEAVCKGCLKDWGICQHHWDCPMLTNLEMLSTADRPQGEWIDIGGYEVCKNCHEVKRFPHWNFCPNCGARMKGANDE